MMLALNITLIGITRSITSVLLVVINYFVRTTTLFNTYVDGNKVDLKMDNNSRSITIGKESVFVDKETGEFR